MHLEGIPQDLMSIIANDYKFVKSSMVGWKVTKKGLIRV